MMYIGQKIVRSEKVIAVVVTHIYADQTLKLRSVWDILEKTSMIC